MTTTSPTSDDRPETASERAVEAFDALPGDEIAVDYVEAPSDVDLHNEHDQLTSDQPAVEEVVTETPMPKAQSPGDSYTAYLQSLPDTADLSVEITVITPDGRRFTHSESEEYVKDDEGVPINYAFEDIAPMLANVYSVMENRLA